MRAKKPYHKRRPMRAQISELCGSVGDGDGLDPRFDQQALANAQAGRKALQLCRQVQHALDDALAGCHDPVLQQLYVTGVTPNGHSGQLHVTVRTRDPEVTVEMAMNRLGQAAAMLRCEVAAAIHRRRTPELAFCIIHDIHD